MIRRSARFLSCSWVLVSLAAIAGCSAADMENSETIGTGREEVRNGTIVTPWAAGAPSSETQAIVQIGGCTGTVVNPSWVLTAQHCAITAGAVVTSIRPSGNVSRTVDVVRNHPQHDVSMLHMSAPIADIPTVSLFSGRTADIVGQSVKCYGYGYKATGAACAFNSDCPAGSFCETRANVCMTGSTELRVATLQAGESTADPAIFFTAMNAGGQTILPGDSGGPCMLGTALAGVNSFWFLDIVSGGGQASVPASKDWIDTPSRVSYTPGDFNGDGRTDVIITNSSGSYWYYSTGVGTWNQAYVRTDLPLGSVSYTPGDFNGDGKTDLIITNVSGSYWYYSTGTGTWNQAYVRTDLPLPPGNNDSLGRSIVRYTPGDFNGDGKTDLIVTNRSGSYFYYSTGTGTWNQAYVRSDLKIDGVDFTPGDFNGDGKTDLIITTASGSYWNYSTGTGTWNQAYTRTDQRLEAVSYTPGDFNGDGKTDVIITNISGSYWYYSTGTGTWDYAYTRTDLPM